MKTILLSASITVFAAMCSCTHVTETDNGELRRVSILLNENPVHSRLTGVGQGNGISNVQLFIYDKNGRYLTSIFTTASSAEAELFDGEYTICALANAAELEASYATDTAMLEQTAIALEDNTADCPVMYGKRNCIVSTSSSSIEIPVARKVARITVNEIANEIKDPLHRKQPFVIKRIFISNVSGSCHVAAEAAPEIWYNRNGVWGDEPQQIRSLLEDRDIESEIPHTGSYRTSHSFYACANNTAEDSYQDEWSPRYTRLVIEASLGDDICYYSIPFGDIKANHSYTVNKLTVTKKGTDNPWDKCESGEFGISVTVTDWETGSSTDKII